MDKSNWNRRHIAIFSEPERPSSAKSDKSTSSTRSKISNKASEHLEEPLDTSKASSRHSSIQISRSNSQSMLIEVGYWFFSVRLFGTKFHVQPNASNFMACQTRLLHSEIS